MPCIFLFFKIDRKNHGFTLIELLVVIAIIGILSTLATVTLNGARAKARDAVRRNDMNQIGTAMQMYYDENNNNYPVAGTCGEVGVITTADGDPICDGEELRDSKSTTYFAKIPQDPQNSGQQMYVYQSGSASTYCIQVNLETTADVDDDDWFICRDGACYPSATDCDGNN